MYGGEADEGDWGMALTSFEALDATVDWLERTYPSLGSIKMTGFSAGAQTALRWIVTTDHGQHCRTRGGQALLRTILGSPSSYVYLSHTRPELSCVVDENTGPNHTCAKFIEPTTSPETPKTCNGDYNVYAMGLGGLEKHQETNDTVRSEVSSYIHRYLGKEVQGLRGASGIVAEELRKRFATKDVRFLFGTEDVKSCLHYECSSDCPSMNEGSNRLQRGLNYMSHLRDAIPNYTPNFRVFNGTHQPELFFGSGPYNEWAFGKGAGGFEACLIFRNISCPTLIALCVTAGVVVLVLIAICIFIICRCRRAKRLRSLALASASNSTRLTPDSADNFPTARKEKLLK